MIALIDSSNDRLPGDIDTSARDGSGGYVRHVTETLRPPEGLDVTAVLASA